MAVGIATFGILAVVALLPIGMQSAKTSLEETVAVNILSAVISDRQATPFNQSSKVYGLPVLTNTAVAPVSNFFGITEGNQFTTQLDQARYRVDYTITPPISGTLDPFKMWLKVSWPAADINPAEYAEGVVTFSQP